MLTKRGNDMDLGQIKAAVESGKTVHWNNENYVVEKVDGQWLIVSKVNDYKIGLTWSDGVTLNGYLHDFYIPAENGDDIVSQRPMTVKEMEEIEAVGIELEVGKQYVVAETRSGRKSLLPDGCSFTVACWDSKVGWVGMSSPPDGF